MAADASAALKSLIRSSFRSSDLQVYITLYDLINAIVNHMALDAQINLR